jgi:hypothetical protein
VQARVKTFLVLFVAFAILYVLISPLPEMAATNSGTHVTFALSSSILLIALVEPFLVFLFSKQVERGPGLSRALLCSRLC